MPDEVLGNCRLCQRDLPLCESHVIPAFVFRWLKETSIGPLRAGAQPNTRIQDGPKDYYFCSDCEQTMGRWENEFSQRIFAPIHDESKKPPITYPYEAWCLKFAVSVVWRVLLHHRERTGLQSLPSSLAEEAALAYLMWRRFLRDEKPHPGRYEVHLLPLGLIDTTASPITSPFYNRYAMRTIDHDLPYTDNAIGVFAKLGKFAFFGFIEGIASREWKNTKLHVKRGVFEPSGTFHVPVSVLAYLSSKADDTAAALASMSDRQSKKVFEHIAGRRVGDETLRAFDRDVALFGQEAVDVTNPYGKNE